MQVGHLTENTLHITRAFAPTCVGHDTIMAEIVTATHDAYKPADTAACDTLWHHITVGLCDGKLDIDGFLSHLGLRDKIR